MTHYNPYHFKKKMNVYKDTQYANIPVCEKIALLFEVIAKEIDASEKLYAEKKFEEAYRVVHENLALCGKLCDILTEMLAHDGSEANGKGWMIYFKDLMHAIVLVSSNHHVERKNKLMNSLQEMAKIWREKGRKETKTVHHHNMKNTEKPLDNVHLDI